MRHLLNTLYVFTENAYLSLDGQNVVVSQSQSELGRVPLHTLESILSFSFAGASPALMGACVSEGIMLSFYTPRGKYLAGIQGVARGNVLLRKQQYEWSVDEACRLNIAQGFIYGKIFNSRWVLERAIRDHPMRIGENVESASQHMVAQLRNAKSCESADSLRGIEGEAASVYFSVFNELILRDEDEFCFDGRNRRPPLDRINAMLSLFYTVLANDCASALGGVGFDSYVGYLHTDRPGRASLALDMMEELRPIAVDRFVISAVNNRLVKPGDFIVRETGEVRLCDAARKKLFETWQNRKRELVMHPYLKEKIPRGLVPHVQALLLARYLRGDIDAYPPFLWK